MLRRSFALAALLIALVAAPAHAVVGGKAVSASAAPWFAVTGLCGGTLIASDRVATAAHCVDPVALGDLERIVVAGEVRRGVRVALPATWRERAAGFARDDVAIVQLDRPVSNVRPVALLAPGAKVPGTLRILGRGKHSADAPTGSTPLRQARLKTVGDRDCSRRWRRSGTTYGARFDRASEVCAIDADSRAPLDSVCAGDSGGPIVAGSLRRPRLVAIISWTGNRCGADGLPTVGAEASYYRAFLGGAEPTWAPVPDGATRVTGDARVGATLACELPTWTVAPERVDFRWHRRVSVPTGYEFQPVGTGPTYVPTAEDRGRLLDCEALGSGPGGRTETPFGPQSAVRVSAEPGVR